jgi:hypothetical protein
VVSYTASESTETMRLPRLRFTVRRLMVLQALMAFELGLGSFLVHKTRRDFKDVGTRWAETGVQLAFLNVLIGGPAWLLLWAVNTQHCDNGPSRR